MKNLLAASIFVFLSACLAPDNPVHKRPSTWTEADFQFASAQSSDNGMQFLLGLCHNYRMGRAGMDALTAADFKSYEDIFRGAGMSQRDIELLRRRSLSFGTDQTFLGLSCSLGRTPRVNKSFYQGIGHNWQAVISDYTYVYLQGDGTPLGMRVNAWN